MYEFISWIAPILLVITTIMSTIAAFNSNKISKDQQKFHKNSILNQREVQLLSQVLELLNIYDIWCTENGVGSEVNFHDSKESNYNNRDEAWSQIPTDIKLILAKASSHSEKLERLLLEWETEFIEFSEKDNKYSLNDTRVKEKIRSMRETLSRWLLN